MNRVENVVSSFEEVVFKGFIHNMDNKEENEDQTKIDVMYENIKKTDELIKEIDKVLEEEEDKEEEGEEEEEEKDEPTPSDRSEVYFILLIMIMKLFPYIEITLFFTLLGHAHLDFNLLILCMGFYVRGLYAIYPSDEKNGYMKSITESLGYSLVYNVGITFFLLTFIYHLMEQSHTTFIMIYAVGFSHLLVSGVAMFWKIDVFYIHLLLIMMLPIHDPIYLGMGSSLQRSAMCNVLFVMDVYFVKMILGGEYSYKHMLNMLIPIWKLPLVFMYIYAFLYMTWRVNFIYHRWSKVKRSFDKFFKWVALAAIKGDYEKISQPEEEEEETIDREEYAETILPLSSQKAKIPSFINSTQDGIGRFRDIVPGVDDSRRTRDRDGMYTNHNTKMSGRDTFSQRSPYPSNAVFPILSAYATYSSTFASVPTPTTSAPVSSAPPSSQNRYPTTGINTTSSTETPTSRGSTVLSGLGGIGGPQKRGNRGVDALISYFQ